MGEVYSGAYLLSHEEVAPVGAGHHHVVLLDFSKLRGKHLRAPPHIHQAIRFPVDIGEFRNDVALDFGMPPQAGDFVLEGGELMPFCRFSQRVVILEEACVMVVPKALLDALGERHRIARECPGEPPGAGLGRVWQAPVPEFGKQERLVAARPSVAVRAEEPAGARGQVVHVAVEIRREVRDGVVLVVVGDVCFEVKIIAAGAVVIHEPGHDFLRLLVSLFQPGAVRRRFLEVRSPAFVDDAHQHDGRVIPVALRHAAQSLRGARLGGRGELVPIGDFVPDENPRFIRGLEVTGVGDLDVAAQQVEAELFRFAHLVPESGEGRRRVNRVREKILVQSAAQIEHFAV